MRACGVFVCLLFVFRLLYFAFFCVLLRFLLLYGVVIHFLIFSRLETLKMRFYFSCIAYYLCVCVCLA